MLPPPNNFIPLTISILLRLSNTIKGSLGRIVSPDKTDKLTIILSGDFSCLKISSSLLLLSALK